ncbi:DUF6614 family protein [Govanella unica]|uniref:Uncharacterized protein n=1 Tax=Govanella unica TaxID=2975056 RepID=A0A9X3Z822_9PROT|nr:DUF6614 family protein [Govania unica]MDA5194701.1 hypothetical protein [Govania unica]
MDLYHVWCDLKDGESDTDFAEAISRFLGHMKEAQLIAGFRLMRRKLGLAPAGLGEFHIMIEIENLAQLDRAFGAAATREDPVETIHHAVNARVKTATFALYRDFPDDFRIRGQEKF